MFALIEKEALKSLETALSKLDYPVPEEIKLEIPPNPQMGDLATTLSFQLAKELKKSPMEITDNLLKVLELPDIFSGVESKGPYINFYVNYQNFSKMVLEGIDENYGQLPALSEKVILEHTSANPNGPLHIGHIRNAIIGDSLARVLKSGGYEVETQYYVNDMGRQIAMVVWGILNLGKKLEEYGEGEKKDHQIGKLYFQVNEKLKEESRIKRRDK